MYRLNNKAKLIFQAISNMGWKYVFFRAWYEFRRRSGLLKRSFITDPKPIKYISLSKWRERSPTFFFNSKAALFVEKKESEILRNKAEKMLKSGIVEFFNSIEYELSTYDWISNPNTGYRYNPNQHWTEIEDFTEDAGDIKYVWEKSRFSYLYTLIRYDYHFGQDESEFVLNEILSWIDHNPINCGPNYKCSQEISIRIFNWTFALNYYKQSPNLTEEVFQKILHSIYWQIDHVERNINFSRISVRNNHAISETFALYFTGLMYPFFPGSSRRKSNGKKWFEEEILFQITPDGTFLQYSMNYHRIVVQLMTWAFYIADLHDEVFSSAVYERASESIRFLSNCLNEKDGLLPNYGANDGALFFKLSDALYRDYRPQLNALGNFLYGKHLYHDMDSLEEASWYVSALPEMNHKLTLKKPQTNVLSMFPTDGYYTIKDKSSFTFVRCGKHRTRPSQADNLSMDIWYEGENILRDAGSYKYNVDLDTTLFFKGTSSHNTIMLGDKHQMQKGPRFIWFEWTQAEKADLLENDHDYIFEGQIKAFTYLDKSIRHRRKILKKKNIPEWIIEDVIVNKPGLAMRQIWNPSESFFNNFEIRSYDKNGKELVPEQRPGWFSELYGKREETVQVVYSTEFDFIRTVILKKSKPNGG